MNAYSTKQEENTFVAKIKLTHFYGYKEKLLSLINQYLNEYYNDKNYTIDYESSSTVILNFHNNTDMANCVSRYLKLCKLEHIEFSKLIINLNIKIINQYNIFLSNRKKKTQKIHLLNLPKIFKNTIHSINKEDTSRKSFPKNLPSISKSVDTKFISLIPPPNEMSDRIKIDNDAIIVKDLNKEKENKIKNIENTEKKENNNIENKNIENIEKKENNIKVIKYNNYKPNYGKKNGWLIQNRIQQSHTESDVMVKSKYDKNLHNKEDEIDNNNENEKNIEKDNIDNKVLEKGNNN